MSSWLDYVAFFLLIFVAIAPSTVFGPLATLVARYVGPGFVALAALSWGSWLLGVARSGQSRWIGLGMLALGALCAAWWIYRLFVPRYRDQAPASEPVVDDR